MPTPLHVVTAGAGPRIVLVHGSAADHATWTIQLASRLRDRFTLCAYDRRGTGGSVDPARADDLDVAEASVGDHADDLIGLLAGDPAIVVGSSFGAVVVLEAARRRPALIRGMVLCEPPLAASDDAPSVPTEFLARFDELVASDGGEAAAEFFLRTVISEQAYERMPRAYQSRSRALWRQIRGDCRALAAYRVDYPTLASVTVPALLLGGDRSAPFFRPTLDALAAHLGRARLAILAGAGHMLHAEAPRAFHDRVVELADALGQTAAVPGA
ncbi:MAG: alpha/beta hydrolase [Kofleriaceae bacterium]|nr:alpha/beta hydrolase [Kofleriaceae bacterium]